MVTPLNPGTRAGPRALNPRRPSAKTTELAQRMEALQEAEDARQVFVLCSGMHTPYIQWIYNGSSTRSAFARAG